MPGYSIKQMVLCGTVTAILAVGATVAFESAFRPPIEERGGRHEPTRRIEILSTLNKWHRPLRPGHIEDMKVARKRYEKLVEARQSLLTAEEQEGIMHLYYRLASYRNMYWLGIPVIKTPSDMWMMQQVISEVRPDFIIEAGTFFGGSALYFAHVLDGLELPEAKVITIDIQDRTSEVSKLALWQRRVQFVHGSSTAPEVVEQVSEGVAGKKVLVVLDSSHAKPHVLGELAAYAPLVSPGSYVVVEDTSLDGMPLQPSLGAGPMAAVEEFLESELGTKFEPDLSREAFLLTFHPGGWLRRVN
jgi:cephalosporin hydroxylase